MSEIKVGAEEDSYVSHQGDFALLHFLIFFWVQNGTLNKGKCCKTQISTLRERIEISIVQFYQEWNDYRILVSYVSQLLVDWLVILSSSIQQQRTFGHKMASFVWSVLVVSVLVLSHVIHIMTLLLKTSIPNVGTKKLCLIELATLPQFPNENEYLPWCSHLLLWLTQTQSQNNNLICQRRQNTWWYIFR